MAEFTDTFRSLKKGQVDTEASIGLKELCAAVRDTGKDGKLTVTVGVAKDRTDPRLIRITTSVKVKLPEMPNPSSIYYIKDDRLISIEDSQQQLDFGQKMSEPKYIDIGKGNE